MSCTSDGGIAGVSVCMTGSLGWENCNFMNVPHLKTSGPDFF